MTRMTGPDCVVMCNLINTYIHISIYIHRIYTVCRTRCCWKLLSAGHGKARLSAHHTNRFRRILGNGFSVAKDENVTECPRSERRTHRNVFMYVVCVYGHHF